MAVHLIYLLRLSPMNQLNRQSPRSRASPLVKTNVRGTPDIHHGRTDSDHSVVSHHSHHSISSTSSAPRMAPLPNFIGTPFLLPSSDEAKELPLESRPSFLKL
jgi:hypothetical protein